MRADELKEIIDTRPFVPIRLHLTSGEVAYITHPDAAIVTKSLVFVGIGVNTRGIADRTTWYNLLHIVKVDLQEGGPRNGHARRRRKRA